MAGWSVQAMPLPQSGWVPTPRSMSPVPVAAFAQKPGHQRCAPHHTAAAARCLAAVWHPNKHGTTPKTNPSAPPHLLADGFQLFQAFDPLRLFPLSALRCLPLPPLRLLSLLGRRLAGRGLLLASLGLGGLLLGGLLLLAALGLGLLLSSLLLGIGRVGRRGEGCSRTQGVQRSWCDGMVLCVLSA